LTVLERVLAELAEAKGPIRSTDLARRVGASESALEGMIEVLVAKGRLSSSEPGPPGPGAAGPGALGAEAVGAEAVGAEAVGAEAVGAEAVGAEAVGAEAVAAKAPAAETVACSGKACGATCVGLEECPFIADTPVAYSLVLRPAATRPAPRP